MTIKELYECALKHNSEDYELMLFGQWDECALPVTEDRLDIDHEVKRVVISD